MTDQKNAKHTIIHRTPIIMCGNQHCSFSRGTVWALSKRVFEFRFKQFPALVNCKKRRLNVLVWKLRLERLMDELANLKTGNLETKQPEGDN